ncbi:hypothetical protein JL475_24260 [Streptomyces sp. M2CJ-2]|uniref:hypothetical protein n=1 Tax=Streptomyces sp. M2CJ-2 TaxID=2803948 RepID=UPI0019265ABF|nr:hypothetical protein [Streptomyces sp. M2CJ-2]MBL3669049.1 hypothetical protein [Streptomyces sp. M2CJ-2]
MSVRMRHSQVEQEIEVPEISVRHYERSGWKRVDGQVVGAPAVDALAAPVETTAAAKGRRRTEAEGEN